MTRRFTTLLLFCWMTSVGLHGTASQKDHGLYVPEQTIFRLELLSPISTKTNEKGDEFTCQVLDPYQFKGATVTGYISKLKASGKANKTSEIALAFRTITMGERVGRFNAEVTEVYDVVDASDRGRADEEGNVKSKSVRKRAFKRSIAGAAIGALIGGALGGPKGAAAGAAIGAGAGLTTTLATKAPELEFGTGTQFSVVTRCSR